VGSLGPEYIVVAQCSISTSARAGVYGARNICRCAIPVRHFSYETTRSNADRQVMTLAAMLLAVELSLGIDSRLTYVAAF